MVAIPRHTFGGVLCEQRFVVTVELDLIASLGPHASLAPCDAPQLSAFTIHASRFTLVLSTFCASCSRSK
jgi:hypothetical protein